MTRTLLEFASHPSESCLNPGLLAKPDGSGYYIAYRKDFIDRVFLAQPWVSNQQYWGCYHGVIIEELNPDLSRTERSVQIAHAEDPRLFRSFNQTWVSYTRLAHRWRVWLASVCMDHHHERISNSFLPDCAANRYVMGEDEKNWTWIDNPALTSFDCVYKLQPYTAVQFDETGSLRSITTLPFDFQWPYGTVRGSTPSVLLPSGERMTIFHSAIESRVSPRYNRKYVAGVLIHEPEWPYRPIKVYRKPLLEGRREFTRWPWCRTELIRRRVVFPCGLVAEPERLVVSYGVDDCKCAVATLSYDELKTYDTGA